MKKITVSLNLGDVVVWTIIAAVLFDVWTKL